MMLAEVCDSREPLLLNNCSCEATECIAPSSCNLIIQYTNTSAVTSTVEPSAKFGSMLMPREVMAQLRLASKARQDKH